MSLPVISDTFQVSVGYTYLGASTAANVFHVQAIGIDAQSIADGVAATWWTALGWPAIMSNGTSAAQVRVTPLDGTSTTAIANAASFGVTGGQHTDTTGGNSEALVLTWYSSHRGRSGRGRLYLPYIAHAFRSSNGASWNDGSGQIAAAFDAYNTAWITNLAGVTRGVVSRLHSAFYPLSEQVVQLGYIGTQRGRLR